MKVTAIIPDSLVEQVKQYSGGANITESLTIALTEWLRQQKLKKLNLQLKKTPLSFQQDFSAAKARAVNRKR